ncbi:hypothetical protein MTE01_33880 [Microbacterium testaceum]|uniref:Uncharacterized protein n=1 Tax=Microbacterium testaceum TaxID=2033 RepID=A0A4Y3QRZ2_MICTE|nr:hypothetical protein [Microbacterium testaceum]GEB47443.1 hypothetical protein MTE01_33880 [Microbacterium testaceum]
MGSHHFETLRRVVIDASKGSSWAKAVREWQVTGVEEDPTSTGSCVCGKNNLRYLYQIENHHTGGALFPIGSVCVNLFEVKTLKRDVKVLRRLFDLRAAFTAHRRVELKDGHFTRNVLADLWENGAFPDNRYNRENGENDYKFLLDLFNRQRPPTANERKKVWALINRTIRPFVLQDDRLK